MGNIKNFQKLRASKYYNVYNFQEDYSNSNELILFLIALENVNIDNIRFSDKKQLLRVLEYIFKNYRLYLVEGKYMEGYTFLNMYTSFPISERDYIVLEYILKLKQQLGGYYMYNYNIYHNIGLNYISRCKVYYLIHDKISSIDPGSKYDKLDKSKPVFWNFPGEIEYNKYGLVDKCSYNNTNIN